MTRYTFPFLVLVCCCFGCHSGSAEPKGDAGPIGSGPTGKLPPSTSSIQVFNDEVFSANYSSQLIQFIATHSAGTQKLTQQDNASFKTYNPNWVMLHYRLGTSSGAADYIINNAWGSDWKTDPYTGSFLPNGGVTNNENWFTHNDMGQRDSAGDWNINDISNQDFRQYWVQSVINNMNATGADGVFADSFEAGISGYGVTDPHVALDGTNAGNSAYTYTYNGVQYTWTKLLTNWTQYIEQQFAGTQQRYLYIPNIGQQITGWSDVDYSAIDGCMLESFADNLSLSDWQLGMNRALTLINADKIVIMQSYPSNTQDFNFLLGTYLLMKGDHTYVNLITGGDAGHASYYPQYTLDLGAPVMTLPAQISSFAWSGNAGVYRRDYEKGIVVVNAGASSYTISLGQTLNLMSSSGGGTLTNSSVDANGNYTGGSLSYTPVSSITLPAQSAAILMK
jgi:hypothetical protein